MFNSYYFNTKEKARIVINIDYKIRDRDVRNIKKKKSSKIVNRDHIKKLEIVQSLDKE